MKVAVVTPYCTETDEILEVCLASVRNQTYSPCVHCVVADGHPNPLLKNWDVQHIVLASTHRDNGNLARCVGAMSAVSEGFDAVAFLDADNWFREDHVSRLVELHAKTGAAVCTSGRSLHRLDGSWMRIDERESDGQRFCDTSCLCIFRQAFDLLPLWGMIPTWLSPLCDTVMWDAILQRQIGHAHSPEPTVCFRTQYANHYRMSGEVPPPRTKEPAEAQAVWLRYLSLPPTERAALLSGLGGSADLEPVAALHRSQQQVSSFQVRLGETRINLAISDDHSTRFVIDEIFSKHCYRGVEGLPAPRTILDIGANIGLAAAYFRLIYPHAELYCVEPDPSAYELLCRNACTIGNCRAYRAGLSNTTHTAEFHLGSSSVLNSTAAIGGVSGRTLLLGARQFLYSLPRRELDLIKIDVEGAELPILIGLREEIARIAVIHLEFHSQSDRRLIDGLLATTHFLWRGSIDSPHRGVLTYVLRSPAPIDKQDRALSAC
jgi:FkbM family methyltransferase